MQRPCICCHKILNNVPIELQYNERIFCDDCAKKIEKELKKIRKENWCTAGEFDEVVKNIQLKENEQPKKHN